MMRMFVGAADPEDMKESMTWCIRRLSNPD